jgi:hypothetical protein
MLGIYLHIYLVKVVNTAFQIYFNGSFLIVKRIFIEASLEHQLYRGIFMPDFILAS